MIPAIVLAAGLSRRMGQFKLLLPWRDHTVIEEVIGTLCAAGVAEIVVITGHRADAVTEAVRALACSQPIRCAFNADFAGGEMLTSVQTGVRAIQHLHPGPSDPAENAAEALAALLCLGDQPQMQAASVSAVLAAGQATAWQQVIIPSYEMRAGHPLLLPRTLWPEILAERTSLRALLARQRALTHYVTVASPSILADLDTPEDYQKARPQI